MFRNIADILMPFRHVSMLFLSILVGCTLIANVPKLFRFNHSPNKLRRKIAETFDTGCGRWQPQERADFVEYILSTREAITVFDTEVEPGAVYTFAGVLTTLAFTLWELKEDKIFTGFSFDKKCANHSWHPHRGPT